MHKRRLTTQKPLQLQGLFISSVTPKPSSETPSRHHDHAAPSAVLAEQFTPEQMLDVMTKSPSNRDARVQDATLHTSNINSGFIDLAVTCFDNCNGDASDSVDAPYLKYFLLQDLRVRKYQLYPR